MADEQISTVQAEVETQAVSEAEPEAQVEEQVEEQTEEPVEEREFDFGGNKFKVPKGAIPEDLAEQLDKFTKGTWSDYTKKSQDVAEQRKAIETQQKVVEKLQALSGETLNVYSRGVNLRQEIDYLEKIDMNALWQSDQDQARRVSDALSQRRNEFTRVVNQLSQLEGQASHEQQQEVARQMDQGRQTVEKMIPGFATKHLNDVIEYAVKEGIPKEEAQNWPLNPLFTKFAHKAMLYDRMQQTAKQAAKAPPVQPAPVVTMKAKGGTAQKDVSKMSVDEMARHLRLGQGRR